jgi:tripeptidyl-peptidase-2
MDCTGSGDIDTSAIATADEAGCITGASGRQLTLSPGWVNPSGQWHVGCRRLFELFPKPLQVRMLLTGWFVHIKLAALHWGERLFSLR